MTIFPPLVETLRLEDNRLSFGGIWLDSLAGKYSTPLYVYNFDLVSKRVQELKKGLGSKEYLICYAVKANSNIALIKHIGALGLGADVVSGGELYLARKAGIDAKKIVFSGVAKTQDEIDLAVKENILTFNVESPGELSRISTAAKNAGYVCDLTLRINPDIDAKTHPKIATGLHATKFGLEPNQARELAFKIKEDKNLKLRGVSCHIGSQMLDISPILDSAKLIRDFVGQLRSDGHQIDRIDLGGGLGVAYHPNELAKKTSLEIYGQKILNAMQGEHATLLLEPGRSLVAECGVLLTRVIEVKSNGSKTFVMVDAAMNDLIRPSLYEAYHHVFPLWNNKTATVKPVDIVGPVCETGDFFAIEREMPTPKEHEFLAIAHTGAYGFSMASNYNSRPKPAEVSISSGQTTLIRKRETLEDFL